MGGNLFKLGRIPRREYLILEGELRQYLDQILGKNYRIPRYYNDKADFGDVDIIVSDAVQNWQIIREIILSDLEITEYKAISHVFSTVYKNFQIDYFLVSDKYFEAIYNFFCFNDLGNLIGKICRRFNLKYGEYGLSYVFRRDDENYKQDILLTTDFARVCEFLGLDYQKWKKGFANLEEMFEWIIASPYFSVKPYLNPSKTLDKRAKERRTIQKFLEYLQENQITKTYDYLENREEYLFWIAEKFPEANLIEQIEREKELERIANQIKSKFNGTLLINLLPELEGKRLGKFIVGFKKNFADFETFILQSSQAEINRKIIDFSKTFNQ